MKTPGSIEVTMPADLFAAILEIVPVALEDGPENFEISAIEVFACFEEQVTTVTTTPAGVTTVSTTTKFTPSGITTTTVKTTPGNEARPDSVPTPTVLQQFLHLLHSALSAPVTTRTTPAPVTASTTPEQGETGRPAP